MKKILSILILSILPIMGAFAATTPQGLPIQMDLTGFISFGIYDEDTNTNDYDDAELFFKSLRGGGTLILRMELLRNFSLGVEAGIGYWETDNVTYIDAPLSVLAKVGFDSLSVTGHVGYYISSFSDLSGISGGFKGNLGGWFLDASVILAENPYTRYTFGYELSSLL